MAIVRIWFLGACFAAGIFIADLVDPRPLGSVCAGSLGVVGLLVVWLRHRRLPQEAPDRLLPAVGLPLFMVVGLSIASAGFTATGLRMAANEQSFIAGYEGRYLEVEGVVVRDLEPTGRSHRFRLRVLRAGDAFVREHIDVRLYGNPPVLESGARIRAGVLVHPLDLRNAFDARLLRDHVVARASTTPSAVKVIEPPRGAMRWANAFRARIDDGATAAMSRSRAGLLLGLSIGDTRLVPASLEEDFRVSGLSHLMAVSGANVAMVLAAMLLVLRMMRAPRSVQIPFALGGLFWFALVTRWEPSVLRATVMASVGLLAFYAGRRSEGLYALGLAFIGLLAVDPQLLWSAGFQLSFAASGGILLFAPSITSKLSRWPRPLAEAMGVAIAAQLAVTPLLAAHFGRVSPGAIPANLLAFPAVPPATVLGLAGGILGGLGSVAFELAQVPVVWLERVAVFFGNLPGMSVSIDWGAVALAASLLLLLAVHLWMRAGRRAAVLPALLAVFVWVAGGLASASSSSPPSGLRVTFFDVGQGDAALVESPGGARVLIDGGPDSGMLRRKLNKRGLTRIDLVVISHLHRDHVMGLERVVRSSGATVWHPGVPGRLIEELRHLTRVAVPAEGDRAEIGDLRIDVLGPSQALLEAAQLEASGTDSRLEGSALNDASLVLRIAWGRDCILFTGDLEFEGQRRLLDDRPADIECSVMKAPHHGSSKIDESFVRAVDPEFVPIPVGANAFGHPTRTALRTFEEAGARVLRTDREGDVVIEMQLDGRVTTR